MRKKPDMHEILMLNELGYVCLIDHRDGNKDCPFKCNSIHCSEEKIKRVVEEIDKAQYSIDVAMYTVCSNAFYDAFKRAKKRGVEVRIISKFESQLLFDLAQAGIVVQIPKSTMLMHHKFCIIDGRKRANKIWQLKKTNMKPNPFLSLLITGSLNWTTGGACANWENVIISSKETMVNQFEDEFCRLWKVIGGIE